ncbi:MAG: TPM domain-containing protein, partial [Patescibacteria group bacterium]
MKKLFYISVLCVCSFFVVHTNAQSADIKLNTYVTDTANMIPDDVQSAIEQKLQAFDASTTNQIVVLTISELPSDETIETYAYKVFQNNGVGQKEKNNGLLFLIALNDRKNRIEVGYGLEGVLPDSLTDIIRRKYITPAFQAGDYGKGVNDAVDQFIDVISKGEPYTGPVEGSKQVDWVNLLFPLLFGIIVLGPLLLAIPVGILTLMSKSKSTFMGLFLGLVGSVILYLITGIALVFI